MTDAAKSQELLDNPTLMAQVADRIKGTAPAPPEPTLAQTAFVALYKTEYDQADPKVYSYTSQSFDAAWIALYGTAWAALNEPAITGIAIAKGLRKLSNLMAEPKLEIVATNWEVVLAAFRSQESVDVSGASGPIDYDPATEEMSTPIEVWGIELMNGVYKFYPIGDPVTP